MMPHPFATDLFEIVLAFLLQGGLIVLPGVGLAWTFNLFGYRSLSPNWQWLLAPTFGLSLVPIIIFLGFRFVSLWVAWILAGLLILSGILLCVYYIAPPKLRTVPASLMIVSMAWIVCCVGLMVDFSAGDRLYPSTVIIDTSFRSQVISSL